MDLQGAEEQTTRGGNGEMDLPGEEEAHPQTGLTQAGSSPPPLPYPATGEYLGRQERISTLGDSPFFLFRVGYPNPGEQGAT